jgi:hypothetical protein
MSYCIRIGKDGPTHEQLNELKSSYQSDEDKNILIKINVKYKVNGHFQEFQGTVNSFGKSTFPLRTAQNNVIYVPYSQEPEIETSAGLEEKV